MCRTHAVYPRFALRKFLQANAAAYLRGDMLVVRCAVELVRCWTSRVHAAHSSAYPPGHQPAHTALLGTGSGRLIASYPSAGPSPWAAWGGRGAAWPPSYSAHDVSGHPAAHAALHTAEAAGGGYYGGHL